MKGKIKKEDYAYFGCNPVSVKSVVFNGDYGKLNGKVRVTSDGCYSGNIVLGGRYAAMTCDFVCTETSVQIVGPHEIDYSGAVKDVEAFYNEIFMAYRYGRKIQESKSRKTLKESSVEAINLSSLANLIYAYGNDLRVLHLNVKGENFKSVHEALNELYDDIFDAYDTVAELAIARGEEVKNPSTVVSIIKPLEARTFNCEEAIVIARDEGLKVLDAVCSIEGYDKAVQPALDNIIVSLDKTLNYVFARWTAAVDAEDPTSELSDGEHFAYRGMFSEQARRK